MQRRQNAHPERFTALIRLLLARGVSIERNSTQGMNINALDLAVKSGIVEVVEVFLKAGANPNDRIFFLPSPLTAAIQSGHTEMADLLRK